MNYRRLQPSECSAAFQWVAEHHYRHCAPAGAVFVLEFLLNAERVGVMLWGRPEARMLNVDADHLLENTRNCFIEEYGFMSEHLATSRKFIRIHYPQIRLCLAYADPEEGHEGTIYLADGWARFGRTTVKKSGWKNREGRRDACGHSKIRYVRTP